MNYEMRLLDRYYNYIIKGSKRIEIRLYDEKRRKIKVGDYITFINAEDKEKKFKVKVTELLKYDSFKELIDNNDISLLGDISLSKEELLKVVREFYSEEEEKEVGVIGIRFELI